MAKFITWEQYLGTVEMPVLSTEMINVDAIANATRYEKNGIEFTLIVLNVGFNNHGDTYELRMPFPIQQLFDAIKSDCIIAEIK